MSGRGSTATALIDELMASDELTRAVYSRPRSTSAPVRVTVEPIELGGSPAYRFTSQLADRALHENLRPADARGRAGELAAEYRQALLQSPEADWQVVGGRVLRRPPTRPQADRTHDRSKRRLLDEGRPVPFLVELGVMTPDGRIRKQRYAKFRQVNRFAELVDDVVPSLPRADPLRVVDFGCGRSYLTFALHSLLTEHHGRRVDIVGLDLKPDVVTECAALAERIGAAGLRFQQGDIAAYEPAGPVDLVVSLHACDTATDEALAQAVSWGARAILAVPCCHKEAYRQLAGGPRDRALAPLLEHGLARERFATLATDALRAKLLESVGYRTQLVEFVDLEHTPKNVLIRAVRTGREDAGARGAYESLRDALGLRPTLERLLSRA